MKVILTKKDWSFKSAWITSLLHDFSSCFQGYLCLLWPLPNTFFICWPSHYTDPLSENKENNQCCKKAFIYTFTVFTKPKVKVPKTIFQNVVSSLSSVWHQVAPLPEPGPLHGHTVVQFPPWEGLGGEPGHVGFDWVSCCSSKYKIRVLCDWTGVGQTHACVGLERNVTYFSVNKLLFARRVRDNGV